MSHTIIFRFIPTPIPIAAVVVLLATGVFFPSSMVAQEAAEYFRLNCMSCHTIGGGPLTGPDLKDVQTRRDREWLIEFMIDPKSVIDRGDPVARQLLQEYRGVVMPSLPTMNRARSISMLDLIERESALEVSEFRGVQVDDTPFTDADVEMGRKLFSGELRLEKGAASCMSCHAVQGIGGLGGGTLGPDLTTVFERYENRRNLVTWLAAPATPTMQAVYKSRALQDDEIFALTAYFENTLQRNPADTSTARLNFLLLGLGGAILLLGLFDVIWSKRFRSVRRALVDHVRRGTGERTR